MAEHGPAITGVAVVIPVNDEEALLGPCLAAVAAAVEAARAMPAPPGVRVIVVLDDCVDGSAAIAARWPDFEAIEVGYRNVGAARAHGARFAVETSPEAPHTLWRANTDADSLVPVDWIAHQVDLARDGAELMTGAIRPNPADLSADQYAAWQERHRVAVGVDRVHGANLGVRADVYLDAGGFEHLAEHEDITLVERLRLGGVRESAVASPWVQTSARAVGRTPGGYAGFVRAFY